MLQDRLDHERRAGERGGLGHDLRCALGEPCLRSLGRFPAAGIEHGRAMGGGDLGQSAGDRAAAEDPEPLGKGG